MRNPQSFNRYVYAGNNPLAAIDPKVLLPIDFIAGLNISVLQIFVLFGLSVWLSNVSAWSIPEIRGVLRWEGSRVTELDYTERLLWKIVRRSPFFNCMSRSAAISAAHIAITMTPMRCSVKMHTDQLISLIDNFELICQGRNWRGQVTFAGENRLSGPISCLCCEKWRAGRLCGSQF